MQTEREAQRSSRAAGEPKPARFPSDAPARHDLLDCRNEPRQRGLDARGELQTGGDRLRFDAEHGDLGPVAVRQKPESGHEVHLVEGGPDRPVGDVLYAVSVDGARVSPGLHGVDGQDPIRPLHEVQGVKDGRADLDGAHAAGHPMLKCPHGVHADTVVLQEQVAEARDEHARPPPPAARGGHAAGGGFG